MENDETDILQYISENNDRMVCNVLRSNPDYLLKIPIEKRKEKFILSAISKDPYIFRKLNDNEKTLRVCEYALDKKGYLIDDIANPSEEMCLRAVKSNPYAIHYVKNPTEEMKLIAIKNGKGVIFWINNPTEEMMSSALKTQGLYNRCRGMPQYYSAVLAYVKKYGASLKHIRRKFKTYEVCKAAIESSPYAIKFVNKSTLRKHPDLLELSSEKWGK